MNQDDCRAWSGVGRGDNCIDSTAARWKKLSTDRGAAAAGTSGAAQACENASAIAAGRV
jgi:hypothetical protein